MRLKQNDTTLIQIDIFLPQKDKKSKINLINIIHNSNLCHDIDYFDIHSFKI